MGSSYRKSDFRLNIRKNLLTVRAVRQWNQLLQVWGAAMLEIFKTTLCQILFDLDSSTEQGVGLALDGPPGPLLTLLF